MEREILLARAAAVIAARMYYEMDAGSSSALASYEFALDMFDKGVKAYATVLN